MGTKKLESGKDFKASYTNCVNVGTATLTVKGIGNYAGTLTKNYKIVPKGTSISKIVSKANGIALSWKKQTTQTNGYQIQYSLTNDFAKKKSKAVKNINTTKLAIYNLKSGKSYYVRIRTYKKVNGKTYFSEWSKSRMIKAK